MATEGMLRDGSFAVVSTGETVVRLGLAPTTWRRVVAGCLLLLSGVAPFLLMADCSEAWQSEAWQWAPLAMLLTLALLMETMLRGETVALWRRLQSTAVLKERWNWFWFSLSTVIFVLLAEAISIASYGRFPVLPHIVSLILNSLLLIFLAGVLFSVTNRFVFSVALIYSAYLLAFVTNLLKVQYLQTTIRPLDVHYLMAFQEFSTFFFGKATVVGLMVAAVVWAAMMAVLWYKGKYRVKLPARVLVGTFSAVGALGLMYCDKNPAVEYLLTSIRLHKGMSNGMYYAERRGFFFDFVSDIPDSICYPPANYSQFEIARAVGEHYHRGEPRSPMSNARGDVNVIVYLVESFMDPADLRIRFTSDPIPAFHAAVREHTSGRVIVPNEFCGSTNTEFEVITGMSCCFLPKSACPYVQYVKRDGPSVPVFFQERGYTTFTAHAGPPYLYDRVRVYQHLRVGSTIWLTERTKKKVGWHNDVREICPTNVDIAGRFPTDESLVDAVIEVSKSNPRYFMYASANSTHSPYNYTGYLASDLDVCDPMSEPTREELKTYINSLRTADRAIAKMLNYFRQSPQKTVVVIIGDHWPPFSNSSEIYAASGCLKPSDGSSLPTSRRVPLLIWSNFLKKDADVVCSSNFLVTEILSRIGLAPTGFLALNDVLRSRLRVLSTDCMQTRDGEFITGEASAPLPHLLEDYRLLQYDILLGEQFTLRGP